LKIAAAEKFVYRRGLIGRDDLQRLISRLPASGYRAYLGKIVGEGDEPANSDRAAIEVAPRRQLARGDFEIGHQA
jgi:hypothetical protein